MLALFGSFYPVIRRTVLKLSPPLVLVAIICPFILLSLYSVPVSPPTDVPHDKKASQMTAIIAQAGIPSSATDPFIPTAQPTVASFQIQELSGDSPQARNSLPSLEVFIDEVADGQPQDLRGIYVEGLLALRIVQQPDGDVGYISPEDSTATQFQLASSNGVVGLLAHNFLSGRRFHDLASGQLITLVYGDGTLRRYRVDGIHNYERMSQGDLRSDFRDLVTGATQDVNQVFNQFYSGSPHLTLQTCIEKDGVWNWGVQFITAVPVDH
jgi:hypothetical protein